MYLQEILIASTKICSLWYISELREFPHGINDEDLPNLPPFKASSQMPEDELKEILRRAIPNSWNKKLCASETGECDNAVTGRTVTVFVS